VDAAAEAGGPAPLPGLTAGGASAPGTEAPLSLMQEQIWFLEQLRPGNIAYNAPTTFRLHGDLDVDVLERSISEIVRRHEILRTTVHSRDGRAVQRVEAPYRITVPVIDLRGEDDPYAASEELVTTEIRTAFALTELPLLRWTLIRLADAEWELVLVEHHIIHDGWTFAVIVNELTAIYPAFAAGRPSPLPEPTLQYADFARWQHEVIGSDAMTAQLEHWRARLAGAPDEVDLPYERSAPANPDFVGATCRVELPADLCAEARAHSRREGVTLYATMLAAYLALLTRHSGQEELSVGSAFGNRVLPGSQDMPGMFVNPVVLRCDTSGDPAFAELVDRSRAVVIDAQANQDFPFARLVRELAPQRTPGRNPLFQVMFNFDDAPIARMNLGEVRGGVLERFNGTAKLDLGVLVIPRFERQVGVAADDRDRRITMVWEYRSDVLSADTVRGLTERYETLLRAALADPALRVSELPLTPPAVVPAPRAPEPAPGVVELFEGWADRTPDATAVVVPGGARVTYAELEATANRLAHGLRARGVRAGDVVGICAHRGTEMVAGVLAALKTGAAYVPLDPAHPAARLAEVLADAGATAVLVQAGTAPELPDLPVLDTADAAAYPADRVATAVDADAAAYLIYTSGSTGRPKGVVVSRASLAAKYRAWEHEYRLLDGPRTHLQLAAFPFDVCTGDIVRAVLSGGTLVICPKDAIVDPALLLATMREHGMDCAELLPSVARLLADHVLDTGASLGFMKLVAVGGEAWTPGEYARLRQACGPDTRVLNVYGLTEATIGNTMYEPAGVPATRSLPIGRPLAGTEAYVLDALLRPVPPGAVGEIVIGGPDLARGYHGRPDLTAERFVPHPGGGGARVYRTGDRGRLLADGSIEYLGRADQQVKVRGFRVELGEIEAVLRAHPSVADAVVAAPGDATSRRLVAYVVPADGETDPAALRAHLATRLPEHMVPGAWAVLDALPRTTSGKLDRRALPEPSVAVTGPATEYVPPAAGLEDRLAAIWREVLAVDRVGADDEFFALGGHSLLAAQVSARIRAELGVPLAVGDLLAGPTVRAL
ncbi:MAG TPA: amino acid adenylation domain-containing protein, partial [Pseudonocardiaceae bacterium]